MTTFIMGFMSIKSKTILITLTHEKRKEVKSLGQQFRGHISKTVHLGLPPPWMQDGWSYFGNIYLDALERKRNDHEEFKDVIGDIRGK